MNCRILKEFIYSIKIGIIGNLDSNKEIINDFLQDFSIKTQKKDKFSEFYLTFDGIPLKFKTFTYKNIKNFKLDLINSQNFDVLIIFVNLYNQDAFFELKINELKDIWTHVRIPGISIMVGFNKYTSHPNDLLPGQKIDEFSLVQKSRELDFQYCFKIQNNQEDLKEIIDTISKDMNTKFQLLDPELFEQARIQGYEFEK